VLVDIDDEELCNECEREPITLDGLKRLWTRLAVDLAQRFDGITVAKGPWQERYGGTGGIGVTPSQSPVVAGCRVI